MKIYTKNGDAGTTNLVHANNIAKSDDRLEVMGTMDELSSHLGLIKNKIKDSDTCAFIADIQQTLITVMAGIADSYNMKYKLKEEKVEALEKEIDRLEGSFERPKQFILPGGNEVSAEIDVARTVARRAERCLAAVSIKFGSDTGAKRYMNRLADYLYMLARYHDSIQENDKKDSVQSNPVAEDNTAAKMEKEVPCMETNESLVQQILMRIGQGKITLDISKRLIEKIEQEAERRGKKAVIATCTPEGNPVAVHVMDGAFLVSFDVAMKKAYTAVAVKMSTMELSKLTQPGQTFYGLESLEGGKMIIFGGGVPLIHQGTLIGGLGISGGTGEEDHSLAEYALSILPEILNQK